MKDLCYLVQIFRRSPWFQQNSGLPSRAHRCKVDDWARAPHRGEICLQAKRSKPQWFFDFWKIMGFHSHGGSPMWMVYNRTSENQLDDLGGTRFRKPPDLKNGETEGWFCGQNPSDYIWVSGIWWDSSSGIHPVIGVNKWCRWSIKVRAVFWLEKYWLPYGGFHKLGYP